MKCDCVIHGLPNYSHLEERLETLEFKVRILEGEKLVKPELTKEQISYFIGFTMGGGTLTDFDMYKKGWYYFENDRKEDNKDAGSNNDTDTGSSEQAPS